MPKNVRSKSLGNLTQWSHDGNTMMGETTWGKFKVVIHGDSIARICATQQETFDDFSYAVISQQGQITIDLLDHKDHLQIITSKFILQIQKYPVRFTFLTPDQRVINEDEGFGISWNGEQVSAYKRLQEGERFIGLGEKTGPLDRRGKGYQNWNTDSFGYAVSADPLYCTTPFYIGIHHQLTYGIFFDNTHKSFFNFGASNNRFSSFYADGGDMNYYFMYGDTIADIIRHYTSLTGRMELPPLWSIGYQQCRYSYYPDKEVISLARTFREKDIPADVIVLDIHYMDQYKIFTWCNKNFTNPKRLVEQLNEMGFKIVIMCDPGIKIEQGYKTYDDGINNNVFLKYPDDTYYAGQVWPGWCHFPDFTNPATRLWWMEQFKEYVSLGIEGFWNDMNEIATWGNMLPENIEFEFDGHKGTMREGRNVYGFQMARSTYEGAKQLLKGKRPFNLTRAGYAGIQRYAAVWTGDNVAYDEHMILGVRMINSMGICGIAFAGYDVGGFIGDADARLFTRWISIGAFSPFFRGHSMINSRDSEPWSYGEEAEQIVRNYIKFRYQILPYIYSLFYEASTTGMPVQRSLAIDYTADAKIYDYHYQNQYLFGPFFLIAPVESNKQLTKVYLPAGEWYYLYNGVKYAGGQEIFLECPLQKLPVFIKAGALIPMQVPKSNAQEKNNELILHIYDGNQSTSFMYYEDDGVSFKYQQEEYFKRLIEYEPASRQLILHAGTGSYATSIEQLKIVFHALPSTQIYVNGIPQPVSSEIIQFFSALEKFDPFYDPEPMSEEIVKVFTCSNDPKRIEITW